MFIIKYDKHHCCGGLGDRIVGLISIKLISKLLKRKFYINWKVENITKYINYKKYDFNLLNISENENDIKTYCYINNIDCKKYLMNTLSDFYPNKINFFHTNQEISQYLYKNKLFLEKDYINDILYEYSVLYTDILIPTDYLNNKINNLISNKSKIVGIQARCGDIYMSNNYNSNFKLNTPNNIDSKLKKIKLLCNKILGDDYNIFFTTDNLKILENVYLIFGKSNVIYNEDLIQHIDRDPINPDISKVFVDNYILSQKTEVLFITEYSNYGRIAALSSNHDHIYDIDNCKKLKKKRLLSKHERLFK